MTTLSPLGGLLYPAAHGLRGRLRVVMFQNPGRGFQLVFIIRVISRREVSTQAFETQKRKLSPFLFRQGVGESRFDGSCGLTCRETAPKSVHSQQGGPIV